MKQDIYKYLIYISLVFLVFTLVKADYLKVPTVYSGIKLIVSTFFLFMGFIANVLAQHHCFSKSGYAISRHHSFSMVGLNIFSKYIPGKIWMFVGKAAYVAAKCGYQIVDLSVLFVRAQVIAIWCGLVLGIMGLLINNALNYLSWIGLLVLAGISMMLFLPAANSAVEAMVNKLVEKSIKIPTLDLSSTLKVLPWFLCMWIFWGIGFYVLADSVTSYAAPLSTAFCFPLAGTIGILFLLAPGGVGIREGVIVGYLSLAHFNMADAITIAAVSRLWFLMGEAFIFTVGFIFDRLAMHT